MYLDGIYSIRLLKSGIYVVKWYMCGLIFIMGKGGGEGV